jgi:hypothetical protein
MPAPPDAGAEPPADLLASIHAISGIQQAHPVTL